MDDLPAITLQPSRLNARLVVLAAVCAALALSISSLSFGLKLSLMLLVCAMGMREYQRTQYTVITALGYTQGQWWVITKCGKQEVKLCGDQLVLPWLVALQFRLPSKGVFVHKRALAIWCDSVPAEEHRRLRVALRFGRR